MTVYFLAQEGVDDALIKIGYSADHVRRASTIGTTSPTPVKVIATIDGGKETEKLIHAQLADSRHHGEWFKGTKQVHDFIKSVNEVGFFAEKQRQNDQGDNIDRDAAVEDLRIAGALMVSAMGPIAIGETRASVMADRLLPKLLAINPLWSLRKLRTIQGRESTNIQYWVIRDLMAVIAENAAELH